MTNPFAIVPDAVRLWAYLALVIIFLALTAWLASGGNVLEALLSFVGALGNLMAASNTGDSPNPFRVTAK